MGDHVRRWGLLVLGVGVEGAREAQWGGEDWGAGACRRLPSPGDLRSRGLQAHTGEDAAT